MKALSKELESTVKVRFPDCDPFNHLNNSRYIDYFINAREDQLLEHYQFDIYKMALTDGIGWVLSYTQIAYVDPANLNELVTIQSRLLNATDRSLLFEASMWDKEKSILKSIMWARLVHYNIRERKSQSHTAELMDFFSQVVHPLPDAVSFDDRVAQLRGNKIRV